MKITKLQLKEIVNEELSLVLEDRQEHIAGIQKKLPNLRKEHERLEERCWEVTGEGSDPGDDPGVCKQRDQVEWRIETLEAQLEQFMAAMDPASVPGAEHAAPVGHLARGEGPFETPEKDARRVAAAQRQKEEEYLRSQRKEKEKERRRAALRSKPLSAQQQALEEIIREELYRVISK